MKFDGFRFERYADWIYILPSIEIRVNAPEYYCKSLTICAHFLVWHLRLFWIAEFG